MIRSGENHTIILDRLLSRRSFFKISTGAAVYHMLLSPIVGGAADKHGYGPKPGIHPLDDAHQMRISPQDRCPVCGMRVIKYPKFSCAVQFRDRSTYYFCGNGCMMRAWVNPEKFLKKRKDEITFVVVRDYFSGRQTDGTSVTWVSGSDVIGPMGPTPVPLEKEKHVDIFLKRHGGKKTFRLSEITIDNIATILGKQP